VARTKDRRGWSAGPTVVRTVPKWIDRFGIVRRARDRPPVGVPCPDRQLSR
jgi:hypothetical protein